MSLLFFQFRNELRKLFARKRTYIGFATFLLVESLILIVLNLPKPKASLQRLIEQNGYSFDQYFSGLTLALMMLMWTTFLLGALFLALVAGDIISKEIEEGTMRMMLCRPVSRLRVGLLKYFACVVYTAALVTFIGFTALLTGVLYKGMGGLFVFAPTEHIFALYEFGPGMQRYLGSMPLLALGLVSVSSLGFMLSCFNMKPAAATIVTLALLFLDSIFRNIPYFESLQPYFITPHMATWLHVFENTIPWWDITEDCIYLLGFDLTLLIVGLAVFHQRDFKS